MKKFLKFFVWFTFWLQLRILFFIKKPYVILVVGGGEKSLIRQKLVDILKSKGLDVKINYRPYNTRFGVALNALDLPSAWSNKLGWIGVWILSWLKFFKHIFFYNKFIVLEGGIDEKGEAKKFVNLLSPHMIIFSSINQDFLDDFKRINIILEEYRFLVSFLNKKSEGLNKISEEGDLLKVVEFIENKEKYIGVFNNKYDILKELANNTIRKIYLINE